MAVTFHIDAAAIPMQMQDIDKGESCQKGAVSSIVMPRWGGYRERAVDMMIRVGCLCQCSCYALETRTDLCDMSEHEQNSGPAENH